MKDESVIRDINKIMFEEDDYYSNDDIFNINSWGADLSFRELINMYRDGDLSKPELQRYYVWDKNEASGFIDSLLLGLPVPSIFLAKTKDEKFLIIDGYQRIMSVYDFVTGIFSKDGKVFRLSNSDRINTKWRGKAFSELNETEQRKIRNTTIHSIIFEQIHPQNNDTSLYQIFERINTGGRTLMPQEIRNCVYQGKLNSLLFELNQNKKWRILYGEQVVDNRMRDMEYILRVFALSEDKIISKVGGAISLKKCLNEFMGVIDNNSDESIKNFRHTFNVIIEYLYNQFGDNVFNNLSSKKNAQEVYYVNKFHPTIFDAIFIACILEMKNGDLCKVESPSEKHLKLIQDKDFIKFCSERTTNVENIKGRINKARSILFGGIYE